MLKTSEMKRTSELKMSDIRNERELTNKMTSKIKTESIFSCC